MIIKSVNINTEKLLYRGLSQFPASTINILLHVSRVFLRGHTLNCEITRKGYTTQASLNLDLTQGNNERDRCTNKKQIDSHSVELLGTLLVSVYIIGIN